MVRRAVSAVTANRLKIKAIAAVFLQFSEDFFLIPVPRSIRSFFSPVKKSLGSSGAANEDMLAALSHQPGRMLRIRDDLTRKWRVC